MVSNDYKTMGTYGWGMCNDSTASTTSATTWGDISNDWSVLIKKHTGTCTISSSDLTTQESRFFANLPEEKCLRRGAERELPDGSRLIIDDKGNHHIEDKDARVTYQSNRIREFSPHLNASDMVAQFVDYTRSLGVKRDEVLSLPLELFIGWLVIEAAERDNDSVPDDTVRVDKHLANIVKPKCLSCGRFIPKFHSRNRFPFCNLPHAARHVQSRKLLSESMVTGVDSA